VYVINFVDENRKISNIQNIYAALNYMWCLETAIWFLFTN